MNGNPVGWIIGGLFLLLAVMGGCSYNNIVGDKNTAIKEFSNIQVAEQRRGDLIPNLVETVKGYAAHESGVFTAVTEARAKVGQMTVNIDASKLSDPAFMKQLSEAQNGLTGALKSLLAVRESYPQLKANENFLALQSQIEGSENRIAIVRRDYNVAVNSYNTRIEKIPGNIVAGFTGFKRMELFQAAEGSRAVPKVDFKK